MRNESAEKAHRAAGHAIGSWSTTQHNPVSGRSTVVRYCECGWEFERPALTPVPTPPASTSKDPREVCAALECAPGWPDRDCPLHGWSKSPG